MLRGKKTPILCINFDGVLHSYMSGWKGPSCIPDPPVLGAISWLRSLLSDADCVCAMAPRYLDFDVQIHSYRSRYWTGRRAMAKWLGEEFEESGYYYQLVELITFPKYKPQAFITIDNYVMIFNGQFPTTEQILNFMTINNVCFEKQIKLGE